MSTGLRHHFLRHADIWDLLTDPSLEPPFRSDDDVVGRNMEGHPGPL